MTDKERLESINKDWGNEGLIEGDDIDWLIEQAERVQDLRKKNSRLRKRNKNLRDLKNLVLEE